MTAGQGRKRSRRGGGWRRTDEKWRRKQVAAGRRTHEAAPQYWHEAVEGRRRRWRRLGTLAAAGVDGDRAEELVSKRRPLVGCP